MSFMPHGSNPQTASFTCNTCGIRFPTAELQRFHMKSDWHRYNLKRRVAQLGPISSEVFAEKVISQQDEDSDKEDEFGFIINKRKTKGGIRQTTKKDIKRGKFINIRGRPLQPDTEVDLDRGVSPASTVATEFSEFSLGESVSSNLLSVTDNESNIETSSEFGETDPDYTGSSGSGSDLSDAEYDSDPELEETIPKDHCIFCGVDNKRPENNVKHMFNKHGLYIPERSYLTDLDGLLGFLGIIVAVDNECLVCSFQGKNLESIRQHMASKGHCRIPYETKEEKAFFSPYYDFSSLYEDIPTKKSSKKVAFQEAANGSITDITMDNGEESFDDIDTGSENDEIDNQYSIVHINKSGVELTLPTGSKIGHRSMQRYYRQNPRLEREPLEGESTVAVADKRYGTQLTATETKEMKQIRRIELKQQRFDNKRSQFRRSNFQDHYRDTILGT